MFLAAQSTHCYGGYTWSAHSVFHSQCERDFSALQTYHLLLQLPMFKGSRDFIVLSLDGSRVVGAPGRRSTSNSAVSIGSLCLSASNFQFSGYDTVALCTALHHAEGVQLRAIKEEEASCRHCQAILFTWTPRAALPAKAHTSRAVPPSERTAWQQ